MLINVPEFIVSSPVRIAIGNFLNIIFIQNNWIFLNLWSVVHLLAGFTLIYILLNIFPSIKNVKNSKFIALSILFGLLAIFEIIEYAFYTDMLTQIFNIEIPIDVIWDLIAGMFGGFLGLLLK